MTPKIKPVMATTEWRVQWSDGTFSAIAHDTRAQALGYSKCYTKAKVVRVRISVVPKAKRKVKRTKS